MQLGPLPRHLPASCSSVRNRLNRVRHRSRHRPRLSRSPSRNEPDGGPDAPSTPQKSPYSVVSRGDPERQNGRKSWKAGERCGSSMQSSRREKTTFAKGWSAPQGTQPIGARQPTAARRAIGLSGCTCNMSGLVSSWVSTCGYLGFLLASSLMLSGPPAIRLFVLLPCSLLYLFFTPNLSPDTDIGYSCRYTHASHTHLTTPMPPSGSSITPSLSHPRHKFRMVNVFILESSPAFNRSRINDQTAAGIYAMEVIIPPTTHKRPSHESRLLTKRHTPNACLRRPIQSCRRSADYF
jgi:hypothetical protein